MSITGQVTDLAFDPAEPRDPATGKWVGAGGWEGIDSLLEREFHPQQLEARRVKHPRSGYMVKAGEERRVNHPPPSSHGNESLGIEGPANFDVYDHGDPVHNERPIGMFPQKIRTEPIRYVYRAMSAGEWEQAQKRGFIQSDERGAISSLEGTNAAVDPRSAVSYLPREGQAVVAKIAVRPQDKWFTINADEYLRTRQPVPLSQVQHVVPLRRVKIGKYGEGLETRLADTSNAGITSQVIELAFNPLEKRDSHGRWTRGGLGPLGLPPRELDGPPPDHMEILDLKPGYHPDKGMQVRDDRGVWGVVTDVAAGSATVVMNDQHRYVIDWRDGSVKHDLGKSPSIKQPTPDALVIKSKKWEFIGPHGSGAGQAFLPGNREPKVGDMARDGQGAVGRVVGKAGGHAAVDADDGNRYLVDWRNGGKVVHAMPLSQAGPALPAHPVGGGVPVNIELDPSPPNRAAPWLVRGAGGAEWHVPSEAAAEILRELRRRDRAAGLISPSPPGDIIEPGVKQYVLPGMEALAVTEYGHRSAPVRALEQRIPEIQKAMAPGSNDGRVSWPEQGNQGSTAMVELPDGTRYISKTQSQRMNDRDELSYYVSQAIGSSAPAVARVPGNERDIVEDVVPGKTALSYAEEETQEGGDWAGYEPDDVEAEITAGDSGNIGLLDYLISNSDRHDMNWMVDKDGNARPIDQGSAQFDASGTDSPFWAGMEEYWDQQTIDGYREELRKIQPEFIRLGHPDWYTNMMYALQQLTGKDMSTGRYRRLLEGGKDTGRMTETSGIAGQFLDLAAWEHELRGYHGKWVKSPGTHGYSEPPPRHVAKGPYPDPADHPFFKAHPISQAAIIATYDEATTGEKAQGERWYADAQRVATAIADGDTAKGAGVLSAYSPQTAWPMNMLNAARSLEGGRAIGPGEGMITRTMQASAKKIMDGMPNSQALKSPKTSAFAKLIEHGGDPPDDHLGQVVIDRHALSVAVGGRVSHDDIEASPIGKPRYYEYVADQYRLAALAISRRDGRELPPHKLQAIDWLVQQRKNQAQDETSLGRLGRGRATSLRHGWDRWGNFTGEHGTPVGVGTTIEKVAEPITAREARGNSRAVSAAEFQRLAADGREELISMRRGSSPITGLDRNWPEIKAEAFTETRKSWGGITVDSHTGLPLRPDADEYALTVKPQGMDKVSVPEDATRGQLEAAMDMALANYRAILSNQHHYLGIFHDDENHRIDIDPVVVVGSPGEVETIGAYTHAIGGAYHFRSGDGFWPPHVEDQEMKLANQDEPGQARWKGPGQWRSAAEQAQPGLSPEQVADIEKAAAGEDGSSGGLISSQFGQS